jgi:hypothetical protein
MRYYRIIPETDGSFTVYVNELGTLPGRYIPASRARLKPIRGLLNSRSNRTCRHSEALGYDHLPPNRYGEDYRGLGNGAGGIAGGIAGRLVAGVLSI